MNLPFNESELQTRQKIHFHHSYMYVCKAKLNMYSGKGASSDEYTVVLIEESSPTLRGYCYRYIWNTINKNDNLRLSLTGSTNKVSLTQVIDMSGYGIITTTEPQYGHFVSLTYHPRIDGKIHRVGCVLGTCDLKQVLHPPQG